MRAKFPDRKLLEDPQAPGGFIKSCHRRDCAGTHDRLHDLHILYAAHQAKRVLLYKWFYPMDLENFLIPNLINWTMPFHERLSNVSNFAIDTLDVGLHWNKRKPKSNKFPSQIARLLQDPVFSRQRFVRASKGPVDAGSLPKLADDRLVGAANVRWANMAHALAFDPAVNHW